jgi:catechol 2,3-dioxygenase-like lactoylglutathione lyase family enzyme
MNPSKLDHVAFWVADRDTIADFVTSHLGMHVIDRTERFTLLGSNARRGKITLFDAEAPRRRGALEHVAFRVNDLDAAAADLPDNLHVDRPRPGEAYFDVGSEGIRFGLVEGETDVDYDLDHVALVSRAPAETADAYTMLGFARAASGASGAPRVEVGGAFVEFHDGDPEASDKPLLNHLAVLVDSADEHIAAANDLGVEIDDVVDAANTYAVFLWGPERVRIEYVEHKPTFSLT